MKAAKKADAYAQWQVILLAMRGHSARSISELTGVSRSWLFEIVRRYNAEGPASMGDRRANNPGAARLLDEEGLVALAEALEGRPADGGLWSGRQVVDWIRERTGRTVDETTAYRYMKRLGYRRRRPRPSHVQADPDAQEDFKRRALLEAVEDIRTKYPDAEVELWAHDEARIGLKPVLRAVWARRGQPLIARQHPRYKWLYVYGFVRPDTGDVHWQLMPCVNKAAWEVSLEEFALTQGVGPGKRVVLVVDGAGWHTGQNLRIPEGIHLVFLPPCSPQLQPAERLWPLTREAVANRPFSTLDQLQEVLAQRLRCLDKATELIRGLTRFHWWPSPA
ncbi:MAG: IS630 family transposase [Alphaproteobacteria bacterium]|nr:IS630 family transposase [Alphaproteobacteria bacterium]MCB9765607.1 IS630 family transposase [Alphaproteobacteria bacterium]